MKNSFAIVMAAACISLSGCSAAHRVDAPSIRLTELAGYPVLTAGTDASQQMTVQTKVALGADSVETCAIHGVLFSLVPPAAATSQWTVTSPSVKGWQVADTASQLRPQWDTFVHDLAERKHAGCFGARSLALVRQTIVDAIPVPVDEALVLRYGFSGEGVADLEPGMELQVERSVLGEHNGKRELQSLHADYAVVATADGVRLKQLRSVTLHEKERPGEIFHLDGITQNATHLRLLLQNLTSGNSVQRPPILLMANDEAALRTISADVESHGCGVVTPPSAVRCLAFHEAVSLLVAVTVNGKPVTYALGTTLGIALDAQGIDPAAATLHRALADGYTAAVVFPQTHEGVARIVLQGGDAITGSALRK